MNPSVRLTFGDYQIASISSLEDAKALHNYSGEVYGEGIFPEGTTVTWATNFPTGHLLMWKQDRLIGEFGIAPLHPQDAECLITKKCTAKDMHPMKESEARLNIPQYWYINGLSIHPLERHFSAFETLSLMLSMVLNNMVESKLLAFPTTILTTAFSPEGERIIQHMNFKRIDENSYAASAPLYRLIANTKNQLFEPMARYGVDRWLDLLQIYQNKSG